MQGLIKVILRGGDVIVKLTRDRPPVCVDYSQGGIAGWNIRNDEPDSPYIPNQIERFPFFHHLLVNKIDVFGSSGDLCFDSIILKEFDQVFLDDLDLDLTVWAGLLQLFWDLFIFFRVNIATGEVLEFPFDLSDAEPAGKGSENIECLFCNPLTLGLWHKS